MSTSVKTIWGNNCNNPPAMTKHQNIEKNVPTENTQALYGHSPNSPRSHVQVPQQLVSDSVIEELIRDQKTVTDRYHAETGFAFDTIAAMITECKDRLHTLEKSSNQNFDGVYENVRDTVKDQCGHVYTQIRGMTGISSIFMFVVIVLFFSILIKQICTLRHSLQCLSLQMPIKMAHKKLLQKYKS